MHPHFGGAHVKLVTQTSDVLFVCMTDRVSSNIPQCTLCTHNTDMQSGWNFTDVLEGVVFAGTISGLPLTFMNIGNV
jgi:hypothetical protein